MKEPNQQYFRYALFLTSSPFFIIYFYIAAETWRRNYPQSYQAKRNSLAACMIILAQAGPGGWTLYFYVMKAPSQPMMASIVGGAMYILGSFFFFNRPWQLPLVPHLTSSVILLPIIMRYNKGVCDTPLMTTPQANHVTERVFKVLSYAHSLLAPTANLASELAVRSKCVVISNSLVVALGFIAPTLLLASREAAMYRKFKRRNSRTSVSPWRHQLYCTLGSKDYGDRMRLMFIALVLIHITWTFHITTFPEPQ